MTKVDYIGEDGTNLAKVLWYYNLIPNTSTIVQKIICPFHNDLRPSMQVDLEKGFFYCHGCGESGNAQKFVKLVEKDLNDLQALKVYFKILKSSKCSDINLSNVRITKRLPSRDFYVQAYDYYHGLSKTNWKDSNNEDVINAKNYMTERGFYPKTLHKCNAKINYNSSYGLIFPMLDNKKFKGWVCRTMIKRVEKKRKYLYNEGFSRATTLVGNYGSKKYVFVVEGYMDRLKFIQFDIDNVVAILGWKITNEQVQKLKSKGVTDIISALDNDSCGRKGTKYLRNFFNVTRFRYIKGVKDPGEMNKSNFERMFSKTMKVYNGGQDNGNN